MKIQSNTFIAPSGWHGGKLPNGTIVNSYDEYNICWNELIIRLEEITGLKVTGYDPSVSLSEIKDGKYIDGSNVQLPAWFAIKLIESFDGKVWGLEG
jgi:hypothetical protein